MAPQPLDNLSPAGSSSYQSDTLTVGDGTWDSTRNDFLLPNLVGLNFETMQYNGMGNRFASFDQYQSLITAHGVIAAIVFLFIVPAAIMQARFNGQRGVRNHIYLQVLTIFLATVVFILGNFAVGPARSLTNPHHGIGVAIYTLILFQALFGSWMRKRQKRHIERRPTIKLMLHQWLGRAVALLGIAQIPLGLTLYGSPQYTFILYALWMAFLVLLYFILSYRNPGVYDLDYRYSRSGGTVIEEKKSGGVGRFLVPLAAGTAAGTLLGRGRKRDGEDERVEVVASRHGSRRRSRSRRASSGYVEEEHFEEKRKSGGFFNKLLAAGGVVGAGALAKSYFDGRKRRNHDEEYSAVNPETPKRRRTGRSDRSGYDESEISETTVDTRRTSHRRHTGPILPGPGNPALAAAAISAAERPTTQPHTPRSPSRPGRSRRDSLDTYSSASSPGDRKAEKDHTQRNGVWGLLGGAWLGDRWKQRREKKEQRRLDGIRAREAEDERRLETERRQGAGPPRYTGDGAPPRRNGYGRPQTVQTDSYLSSDFTDSAVDRAGPMPPLPPGDFSGPTSSHREIGETVPPPTQQLKERLARNDPAPGTGLTTQVRSESAHRQGDPNVRTREDEAAIAAAGAAAALAAEERLRSHSRSRESAQETGIVDDRSTSRVRTERSQSAARENVQSPPVSVKITQHNDRNRNVTVRRLTEEEAAAERRARRGSRSRSMSNSSLSNSGLGASRRYRRDESARRAGNTSEHRIDDAPLSPPRPAFAGGRAKDSTYYSGTPSQPVGRESVGSPGSHGTWSAMSPSPGSGANVEEDIAERRRRRRAERQRQAGTVDFT